MNAPVVLSSPSDAVAVAPVLLGFQPLESVVVLGVRENTLVFTARVDLDDAVAGAVSILTAAADAGVNRLDLIGYSQRPIEVVAVMTVLSRGPFDGLAGAQFVTDGTHAWRVDNGLLLDKEPFTAPNALPQPTATRDEAVAAVTAPRTPAPVRSSITRSETDRLTQLHAAITAVTPLSPTDAAEAAEVLHDVTSGINVVIDAIHTTPVTAHDHLITMRRYSATEHLPAVLAMLVIACWASDSGATASTVRDELSHHLYDSPLLGLIDRLICTDPRNWRNA